MFLVHGNEDSDPETGVGIFQTPSLIHTQTCFVQPLCAVCVQFVSSCVGGQTIWEQVEVCHVIPAASWRQTD